MSTETKVRHTPGPWHFEEDVFDGEPSDDSPGTIRSGLWSVATIEPYVDANGKNRADTYGEEARANGRLIAAAPELLEALKELEDAVEDPMAVPRTDDEHEWRRLVMNARAAIAKAEGEETP